MEEGEVSMGLIYKLLNNTVLYKDWIKQGYYSDDIMDIDPEGVFSNTKEDLPLLESTSVIELGL